MKHIQQTAHLDSISSFLAMEIFAKAEELEAQGRDIIHLEVGEPDFQAPKAAVSAVNESLSTHPARYTHTQGIAPLREAIALKYRKDYGVKVAPKQILVSGGSSIPMYIAVRMLAPSGSEVIVTDPCYACYESMILMADSKPVRVRLRLEDGFQLDPREVKRAITPRTRAIIINSPMNPTGVVFSRNCMKELASLGIPVISDEIYADLSYEEPPFSFMEFTPQAAVLNGFSKYYAMTGWRLGYLIAPPEWISTAARVHQNLMISANQFVQEAGIRALQDGHEECERMMAEFNRRRLHMLTRLKELGLDPGYQPNSGFYIFLKYRDQRRGSLELCLEILEKAGVALTPGIDFGPGGEGFVRFSYANSMENLDKALDRLAESQLL